MSLGIENEVGEIRESSRQTLNNNTNMVKCNLGFTLNLKTSISCRLSG
jgi:hypothetical protein